MNIIVERGKTPSTPHLWIGESQHDNSIWLVSFDVAICIKQGEGFRNHIEGERIGEKEIKEILKEMPKNTKVTIIK